MDEDKKEIKNLLKNIQEGLSKYSVSELNKALIVALNKKQDNSEHIDFVFKIVTQDFGISIQTLKSKNPRGLINDAKQITYCLLHFTLGLSIRHIAQRIFFNWHTSVAVAIKRFKTANVNVKNDKQFLDRHSALQTKLIDYINKQKQ